MERFRSFWLERYANKCLPFDLYENDRVDYYRKMTCVYEFNVHSKAPIIAEEYLKFFFWYCVRPIYRNMFNTHYFDFRNKTKNHPLTTYFYTIHILYLYKHAHTYYMCVNFLVFVLVLFSLKISIYF